MVMETPTPQCVGREFVRQYYTLLNKAPLHLHRFYSHDSIFLHGGLDRPGQETRAVVGQQDIHERIMQLGFRDCHAKIIQVDSLETVGNGVVVLVTGELSNSGGPMRRFTQTFVLVLQSPKKYYVRNDIFRYQDEIFSEDDADIDTDETLTQKSSNTLTADHDDNVGFHENDIVRNGSVYGSEVSKFTTPLPPRENTASPPPELEVESTKSDWDEEEEEEEDEDLEEEEIQPERTTEDLPSEVTENPPTVSQEPKTYANMVSKNASSSAPQSLPVTSNTTSPVSNLPATNKTEQQSTYKTEGTPVSAGQVNRDKSEGGSTFGQQGRVSRPRLNSGRTRFESGHDSSARSPEDSDVDKRKPAFIHYPDSQQLFVGNLTHSITEEDLKNHFTQFGKVLDMRINTKQPQKIGGGKVPNFGFIVFDDAESVQKVLSARIIIVVLDTNILIHKLTAVKCLLQENVHIQNKDCKWFMPFIVVEELDILKDKHKQYCKVMRAVKLIKDARIKKTDKLKLQSLEEMINWHERWSRTNDQKIAECCIGHLSNTWKEYILCCLES